jgi:hypothetical protein
MSDDRFEVVDAPFEAAEKDGFVTNDKRAREKGGSGWPAIRGNAEKICSQPYLHWRAGSPSASPRQPE